MTQPDVPSDAPAADAPAADAPAADAPEDWDGLGVRADAVEEWRALGADAFLAALAQGDGYGPVSASHVLAALRATADSWREAGLASADGLRWHRAGFAAAEASEWHRRGVDLDQAALAAGHRMVG